MTQNTLRNALTVGLGALAILATAPAALADQGGVPHGSPDTCGVGRAETQEFIADPTYPGVSEISTYPPVEFGCTGP